MHNTFYIKQTDTLPSENNWKPQYLLKMLDEYQNRYFYVKKIDKNGVQFGERKEALVYEGHSNAIKETKRLGEMGVNGLQIEKR